MISTDEAPYESIIINVTSQVLLPSLYAHIFTYMYVCKCVRVVTVTHVRGCLWRQYKYYLLHYIYSHASHICTERVLYSNTHSRIFKHTHIPRLEGVSGDLRVKINISKYNN